MIVKLNCCKWNHVLIVSEKAVTIELYVSLMILTDLIESDNNRMWSVEIELHLNANIFGQWNVSRLHLIDILVLYIDKWLTYLMPFSFIHVDFSRTCSGNQININRCHTITERTCWYWDHLFVGNLHEYESGNRIW